MPFLRFFILVISLVFMSTVSYAEKQVDMGATALKIGQKSILAISFKNLDLWHTYWKNPGDAGLAIKTTFEHKGKELKLKSFPWPAPKRYIEAGNMWAYGYSKTYSHFYELPPNLVNAKLNIKSKWLVCKDICIPGSKEINLTLNDKLEGQTNKLQTSNELTESFNSLPVLAKPKDLSISLSYNSKKKKLALHYTISNVTSIASLKSSNILTPYITPPLDFKHEEAHFDSKGKTIYARSYIDWDGEYEEPSRPLPMDGIFKKPITLKFLYLHPNSKTVSIIKHEIKQFSLLGDKAYEQTLKSFPSILGDSGLKKSNLSSIDTNNKKSQSILYYILFAFIGGLILNLMPCVLPVISLKLFALINHKGENKSRILKHNLSYTLGVLFSFAVLALSVYLLKISGEKIGWGFQLQSPPFVFGMILIIFIMGLNMLGLFEFRTPGGSKLGGVKIQDSFIGDFINGILATILSTPCSAPFLGTALTFAFTTSNINIFIVFLSVGVGLSFPFILTGIFPSLISFLPRPGAWMEKLKYFLGITLIFTVIWLIDILQNLINFEAFGIQIMLALTAIFFAFFFNKKISKNKILNLIVISFPIIVILNLFISNGLNSYSRLSSTNATTSVWKSWSKEKMSLLSSEKKASFINFTATWCLTCKVNKRLVLNTDSFQSYVKEQGIELLEGDWTQRDDNITDFLKSYGVVGVPAYFYQDKSGKITHLGETISLKKLKDANRSD